jgi:cardiolipin synthase A/B
MIVGGYVSIRWRFFTWLLAWSLMLVGFGSSHLACTSPSRQTNDAGDDGFISDEDGGGSQEGSDTVDGQDGPDNIRKVACDPYSPRDQQPSLFIGPDGLQQLLLQQMQGASRSIDLMMYQLTVSELVDGLIAAKTRGVTVRVLFDGNQNANQTARTRLTGAGIEVRNSPSNLTNAHSKVMILDQKHAVVMSANMNSYSMNSERNYGVIDDDPYDLSDLQAVFEADWSGMELPSLSCTRMLISPVNSGYWIKNLISKSQTSLELEVMYLTDTVIKAAVIAQSEAGVPVRVMLADPAWMSENPATAAELVQAGIEVK